MSIFNAFYFFYFFTQYNQLNKKGNELLRDIRGGKHADNVANDIPIYIRYLKASLMDFEGKTNNLKYYLLSFYLTAALFMAFTPLISLRSSFPFLFNWLYWVVK